MPRYRKTCGDPNVDRIFDDVYRILNRLQAAPSTSVVTSNYMITDEGGFAVKLTNGNAYTLDKGVLVRQSSSANRTVIIADENDYDIFGVVYESILSGSTGYIILFGICDVLFNSNGATRQNYFRMSKSADTGSTDTGKAQSDSINRIDSIRLLGYVMDTIVGGGLARCNKLR